MKFFSIGVYNTSEDDFFNKLVVNDIDTFCDIRQRRGVRGAKYSFVNSNRLQEHLSQLDIKYNHILELAPTKEIRNIQNEIDLAQKELKRDRQKLGKKFKTEYKNKILNNFNFQNFIEKLEQIGAKNIVFFCVEEHPEACHRSIVTKRLNELYNYKITHI